MKTLLILGATSGIAHAAAAEFARQRWNLVLAGRDREELDALAADFSLRFGIKTATQAFDALSFDRHAADLQACFDAAADDLAGVLLAVGYLGDQRLAERDPVEAGRILDSNFTGCLSALHFVANHFERRRRGFICVISSVAGDRGRRKNHFYGAAKAGLTVYLEGLRARLFRVSVRVITVKPGFVDTAMTFGHPGLFLVATPESVGRGIFKAIARNKDVVYLPWFWRLIMLAARMVPERIFKRLSV